MLAAILVEGRARADGDISKCPVVIILIKNAGRAVAGDVDVGPTIIVEVERGNTERVASIRAIDVCLDRDIFEGTVAAIVIQNIFRARQAMRIAHDRDPLPDTGSSLRGCWRAQQIEIYIVGHDQIKQAITVVVDERAPRTPGFSCSGHSSFIPDFGEHTFLVMKQAVLAVISNV